MCARLPKRHVEWERNRDDLLENFRFHCIDADNNVRCKFISFYIFINRSHKTLTGPCVGTVIIIIVSSYGVVFLFCSGFFGYCKFNYVFRSPKWLILVGSFGVLSAISLYTFHVYLFVSIHNFIYKYTYSNVCVCVHVDTVDFISFRLSFTRL